MPGDRHGGWIGRIGGGIVLIWALLGLTACDRVETEQRDTCLQVLPVLAAEPATFRVTALRRSEQGAGVSLEFVQQDATGGTRRYLTCRFAGEGVSATASHLIGVATDAGDFNETQIFLINRFWIGDPIETRAASRRVTLDDDVRGSGFMAVSFQTGFFVQQMLSAIPAMALYAMLALGYSLVYGLTNRFNLAFGEIAMLGAFASLTGVGAAVMAGLSAPGAVIAIAMSIAVVTVAGAGGAIGRTLFAPLLSRGSRALLVATLGLSIALQEFMARVQGVSDRWLPPMLNDALPVLDGPFTATLTPMQALSGGLGIAACGLVLIAMVRTQFGRNWRAVADDRRMAEMMGVNPAAVLVGTFAVAGGLGGLAGAVMALQFGVVNASMGTLVGLKALVAAIVGGIGSPGGAVLGGMLIGLIETLWSAYRSVDWRDAVIFVLLVAFLVLRPEGLVGVRHALEEE